MRHDPGRFTVIETHPGGGQYDCLSLYDEDNNHILDFNRIGRIHFWKAFRGGKLRDNSNGRVEPLDYEDAIKHGANTREIVYKIFEQLGIPKDQSLP